MSVARVLNVSGVTEEVRPGLEEDSQKIGEFIQAQEGFEHSYLLRNTAAGEGLRITVWRDEAALEAALKAMDEDDVMQAARARVASLVTVSPGLVYEFVER